MSARDNILAKLRQAATTALPQPQIAEYYAEMSPHWPNESERLKHWARTMRSVKTEVYWVSPQSWPQVLCDVVQEKGLANIVLPLGTEHGNTAQQALQQRLPETHIQAFDRPIEDWKDTLFAEAEAGFTDVHCGIAQTGTLMLWPSTQQPRSLSLVPPVHIALFDTSKMYDDFYSAMQAEQMANAMPSNVVLVSGPSKTADIQLTLAYGAHGPRDMVVLAVLPPHIQAADLEES